ncbi:MAG: hypothetical protein ACJA16_005478 [Akkermansiaceae bacterium]
MRRVEIDGVDEDGFGREFGRDLVFGATKDEGTEAGAEEFAAFFVVFFFDGVLVVFSEALERPEEAGHEEAEEGPEFAKVVFDRGAGEANAVAASEFAGCFADFGRGVFDMLGLVEDDELELVFFKFFDVALDEREGGDDEVGVGDVGEEFFALGAVEDDAFEGRGKFFGLGKPVGDDGGGGYDEDGAGVARVLHAENVGEGLEGFSKAHVIGEDAVELVLGEKLEPLGARFLVVSQFGLEAFGSDELFGFDFFCVEAFAEVFELGRGIDREGFGF